MSAPRIHTRAEWGARHREGFGTRSLPVSAGDFAHHSVTNPPAPNATFSQDAAAVRHLEDIGQARFGGGISYPYLILPSGRIFEGLRPNRIGAHTRGYNTRGIAFCFVGNYQSVTPNAKQVKAASDLRRHLIARNVMRSSAPLRGHRDVGSTACPGDRAYPLLPGIRSASLSSAIAPSKEAPVTVSPYRIVTAECSTLALRNAVVKLCRDKGMEHAYLGRAVVFHGGLKPVGEVEDYIKDNATGAKRTHGVVVEAGTHRPLGQHPPHGRFTDEQAFAETSEWKGRYDWLVKALKELVAKL